MKDLCVNLNEVAFLQAELFRLPTASTILDVIESSPDTSAEVTVCVYYFQS